MRGAAFALALAALGSGCVTYERGVLAAASTHPLDIPMTVVKEETQGRSCRTVADPRYALAVEDALKGAPGANALVNATYRMEQALCIVVEGTAVRVP